MSKERKILIILIIITLIVSMSDLSLVVNAENVRVSLTINGENIESDASPLLQGGRTIAPVRIVSEKLGAYVDWNASTRTVTIKNNNDTITLQINSKTITRNNQNMQIDIAPQIIDGRTYVPLRFVSEVLGYEVDWNGQERRVYISSHDETSTNPSASIKDIARVRMTDDNLAVYVEIDGDFTYNTMLLSGPDRLVIDFPKTSFDISNNLLDSQGVLSRDIGGEFINKVRASQFSYEPLTSRVVLDLTSNRGYSHIEKKDGFLVIYYTKTGGNQVEPIKPDEPDDKPVENGNQNLPMGLTGHSLNITSATDSQVLVKGLIDEQQETIYGYINASMVNLRSGPSLESDVGRTLPRNTKLEVIGQTTGWYQVIHNNTSYWISDEYFAVELELLRNNVNVRSGPGLTFTVLETLPRGSLLTVIKRQPDWYQIITPSGKTGYMADYLIGLNERLIDSGVHNDTIAKDLVITFENTHRTDLSLGELPEIVVDNRIEQVGSDAKVHLSLSHPIAYRYAKTSSGLQVDFGSVLTNMTVSENENRVVVDMYFDAPTRFNVNQNLAMHNMMLEFMYAKTTNEQIYNVDGEIVKKVETKNTNDSFQVHTLIGDIGTYKLNTIGYAKHVRLELVSSSLSGKIIAIDPGHGGNDPGASHSGIRESDIVLEVSLLVRDLLLDKGVTVVMTRDTNRTVSLGERVDFVNQMSADIAISVHANSSTTGSPSGVETIYYPRAESERLARVMQNALVTATGFRSRGIKARPEIRFTRETNMPSALLEIGFINNASERAYITSKAGQQKIAENIVAAIERFFLYQ